MIITRAAIADHGRLECEGGPLRRINAHPESLAVGHQRPLVPRLTGSWEACPGASDPPAQLDRSREPVRPAAGILQFATYQAIARGERRPCLYHEYPQDFFDLAIVDECRQVSRINSVQVKI